MILDNSTTPVGTIARLVKVASGGTSIAADYDPIDPGATRPASGYYAPASTLAFKVGDVVEVLEPGSNIPWVRRLSDGVKTVASRDSLEFVAENLAAYEAQQHPDLRDRDNDLWTWRTDLGEEGAYVLATSVRFVDNFSESQKRNAGRARSYVEQVYGPVVALAAEPEPERPERPTVVLPAGKTRENAGLVESYATGKEAALINQARIGEAVDAQALDAAVTKALSSIAADVREARRREPLTSAARSILHRTSAVINNHLDALPTYEPGERSPRIKELEDLLETERQAVRDLRAQRTERNNEITRLTDARQDADRQSVANAQALRQAERQRDKAQSRVESVTREVSAHANLLNFLIEHYDAEGIVKAYRAGRNDGKNR